MGDKSIPAPPGAFNSYPYSLNFQSSTSVAIIIVVLGATFFFMFLFVVYIKRCSVDQRLDQDSSGAAAATTATRQSQIIHGLDPEILKKFPIMPFSTLSKSSTTKSPSPFECAVCLGAFEDNELLRLLPACNHLFHPDCIDLWLQSHSTCPLCRRSLSRDAVSGHLQRALAAIAAPFISSAPASPVRDPSEPDPEAGTTEEQQVNHQAQILRALSRNSESFKLAAHVVEVQDLQDRLRVCSSARFASPQQRVMSPIPCGLMMQHSHSFTELSSASSVASQSFISDEQQELVPAERMKRTMSLSSLRRSLSASEPQGFNGGLV